MTQGSSLEREPGLVVGILLTHPEQMAGEAFRNIEKIGSREGIQVDIAVRNEGQTALDYALSLQARYADEHILWLHESVNVSLSVLGSVRSQIQFFSERNVAWGVIGNSGITFPYFKPVCNLLVANSPMERCASALPAAHLDPYLLLLNRDLKLSAFAASSECPRDAPLNDLAGLAAWEAEKPCWVCNLPVYVSGSYVSAQTDGDSGAWARFLATRYNNASFVSSYGTVELTGHAADTKDYYYGQMEPVLNRATKRFDDASLTMFLVATYYDPDIFDRCLMSIVSQFQMPERLFIIGLNGLDEQRREQFKEIVERYRHYVPMHWAEEDLPNTPPAEQLYKYLHCTPPDGYSIFAYDTFVLFPQAVRQICEFFQLSLRDRSVLPITTVEISRLYRAVESRLPSRPRAFFREIEKLGFSHKERWLSSESNSILHFTFPNEFVKKVTLSDIDLADLGSCLPPRLLSEPLSFFLIERGAGYMSFQMASPDETISPIIEAGTPMHLANKAHALLAARSNIVQYSMNADKITSAISYREEGQAAQQQAARREAELRSTVAELESHREQAEHELARLHRFAEEQERILNRFRSAWHFRARRRISGIYEFVRNRFR